MIPYSTMAALEGRIREHQKVCLVCDGAQPARNPQCPLMLQLWALRA